MKIDANNFFVAQLFCSSSGFGDIREKHKLQKQLDVYFCYSLYVFIMHIMCLTIFEEKAEIQLSTLNGYSDRT